jgi:hypothetical protein
VDERKEGETASASSRPHRPVPERPPSLKCSDLPSRPTLIPRNGMEMLRILQLGGESPCCCFKLPGKNENRPSSSPPALLSVPARLHLCLCSTSHCINRPAPVVFQLIKNLQTASLIQSLRVAQAMSSVDRACYVPRRGEAYVDAPTGIGFSATISAPHMCDPL